VQALSAAAGPTVGPTALVDREELLDVLDFPANEEAQEQAVDEMAEMGEEAAQEAWQDIMDVEALDKGNESLADFTPELHPRNPDNGKFIEKTGGLGDAVEAAMDVDVDAEDESMAERAADKYQDVAGETVTRVKSKEVAENTFDNINDLFINDFRTGLNFSSGRSKQNASLELQAAARPDTFRHEMGHAIADAHGFGISTDAAREGDLNYDSDEDNFVPVDLSRDDLADFKLTQQEGVEPPEEVANLIDAVNSSWERLQERGQEDESNLEDFRLKSNYSALNAHEFLAQLHEEMQSDTLPANASWFYEHDELLPAYTEVAEPSERVKELITFLHNNREGSPFDEDPYPNVEPEL
jgi:hypothetical protein